MAPYTRLKQWPSQAKPSNFLKLIERLHFVRQFPVNDGRLAALPESRLSGLAAEGNGSVPRVWPNTRKPNGEP